MTVGEVGSHTRAVMRACMHIFKRVCMHRSLKVLTFCFFSLDFCTAQADMHMNKYTKSQLQPPAATLS
jgi:hypothetical protein